MEFIPDFSTLIQFAIAVFVIALTPGPDMTLFIGRALSHGRVAGFAAMSGAMTGIVIHTMLVALGLSALIVAAPTVFLGLKIGGALYLLWLAFQSLRYGCAFNPQMAKADRVPLVQHWLTGLGVNLLNPKIILFFMTFLPQFVSVVDPVASSKLMFLGALFILISLPIAITLIWAADQFSAFLKIRPKVMRTIDYVFAGVFSAFAIKVLLTEK